MSSPAPAGAIDAHAHAFSSTAAAIPGARYRPRYEAALEAWQSQWRTAGVTHGVLVQPSFFGTDNRELLAAVARDPAHLRAVAVIDPGIEEAELDRLAAGGVRGVRLNLKGAPGLGAYASLAWTHLYERVEGRGWHVEVFTDAGALPRLVPAFAQGSVPVVLDHFGHPGTDLRGVDATFEAARDLAERGDLWCKLSGEYRLGGADCAALARRWIDLIGAERLVWGSDWPWTGHEAGRDYAALRRDLDRWVGKRHARAILWDNAARLYGFA